jgi:OOP family OmpA-OmpF porin
MLKKGLTYCLGILLFPVLTMGQSLVVDGGFENYKYCPVSFTTISMDYLEDWTQATAGTADYYNTCSRNAGVPSNVFGEEPAKEGKGYIGLVTYAPSKRNYREYMQSKLTEPLLANQEYCVEFWVSLADFANYRTDALGVYLSKEAPSGPNQSVLELPAQLQIPKSYLIRKVNGWIAVSGVVVAEGGEEYITIGNFRPDYEVRVSSRELSREGRVWDYAYYYIDELSVKPIKDSTECSCTVAGIEEALRNPTFPEPAYMRRIELGDINFDFDKSDLKDVATAQLNRIDTMLKENENYYLEIIGYTDSIGSHNYNDTLSMKRAQKVQGYLLDKGTPDHHLRIRYYGEALPHSREQDDEGRAKNRRVEFILWEE